MDSAECWHERRNGTLQELGPGSALALVGNVNCDDSVTFHIKVSPVFNFPDQIGLVIAL